MRKNREDIFVFLEEASTVSVPTELGQCTAKDEDRILAGAAPITKEGIICTRSSKMSWKEIDC